MVKALVIRAAGTNCDAEMARAFELAGAKVQLEHVDRLCERASMVDDADLIGFPGGFSYGDDIASGRILAVKLRQRLYPALRAAAQRGAPMIGICNGFQVMVQVGLLPGPAAGEGWSEPEAPTPTTSLAHNSGGRFIDRWVKIEPNAASVCIWTRGLSERFADCAEDALQLPIAHGEGRFVARSAEELERIESQGQVALRYATDVNGSTNRIAGICDAAGRIFGLMPHPERYVDWTLHPYWTRLSGATQSGPTPGMMMFQNAVSAARGAMAGTRE